MAKEQSTTAGKTTTAKKKTVAKKKAAKKTAAKKTAAKKTTAKKTAVNKKTVAASAAPGAAPARPARRKSNGSGSTDQLRQMIAEAAYYRAEQRNFMPGAEVDDWLAAERQIMQQLQS